jgi:hypothetical protein
MAENAKISMFEIRGAESAVIRVSAISGSLIKVLLTRDSMTGDLAVAGTFASGAESEDGVVESSSIDVKVGCASVVTPSCS